MIFHSSTKDTFKSMANESLTFDYWALGQPNNFGNDQNFVSISYPSFKWGDWSGDTIGEVICQQEIKGSINELFVAKILVNNLSILIISYRLLVATRQKSHLERF